MSESKFKLKKEVKLSNPILIEGLPGIGYVGKLAADHLVEELEAEEFAEMTSPHFPHHVTVDSEGILDLVKIKFYHKAINEKDLVILGGDVQSSTSEGHYEIANKLLDIMEDFGLDSIFTLGGYATGKHSRSKPKVVGASNCEEWLSKFREHGIDVEEGSGPIIGISGLLLSLAKKRGINGSALLGETHGMLVDHRSAQAVLNALTNILDFQVDMSRLKDRAKKTENLLNELLKEKRFRKFKELEGEEEDVSYIG